MQKSIADLQRARTELVNQESAARLAKQKADQAVVAAQSSQDAAVAALTQAQQTFGAQQTRTGPAHGRAVRGPGQARPGPPVVGARRAAPLRPFRPLLPRRQPAGPSADWDRAPGRTRACRNSTGTSGGIPRCPRSPAHSSAVTRSRSSTRCSASPPRRRRLTQQMGRSFLQKLGILPTPTGYTNDGAIPRVYGQQASEYVIKRAGSQMGVPYSWGGGNAAGPSNGIDSGAGTVGFDCSGLILYAFAGVGIKLPHYSGVAVRHGPQDPVVADAPRRRDLLRPRRQPARHALPRQRPDARGAVHRFDTSRSHPVRTSGMTPYVIRYIEY